MKGARVALVTGGAVRVGGAISERLAEAGFRLVVNFHTSEEAAGELVGALNDAGRDAVALQADVTDAEDVERLVEGALAAFGRIDLLVNNAASFEARPFLEVDDAMWNRTLGLNLGAPFQLGQRVGKAMWEQGNGRIVNICGAVGIQPRGNHAPYRVSKVGLSELTRCMAEALAPRVQVNGVAPGAVLFPEETTKEQREQVLSRIPAGRIGTPRDVADAVLFFATAPDYITGTVLRVDGGVSLTGG